MKQIIKINHKKFSDNDIVLMTEGDKVAAISNRFIAIKIDCVENKAQFASKEIAEAFIKKDQNIRCTDVGFDSVGHIELETAEAFKVSSILIERPQHNVMETYRLVSNSLAHVFINQEYLDLFGIEAGDTLYTHASPDRKYKNGFTDKDNTRLVMPTRLDGAEELSQANLKFTY